MKLVAATLLLAGKTENVACPDCISRTWQCNTECSPGSSKRHTFDFQYHLWRCAEIIPLNGSAIVDVKLWCVAPRSKDCRTIYGLWYRCSPKIGCDNMRTYSADGLSPISSLKACGIPSAEEDFLSQNCQWICKNGAPHARCTLDFDRAGKYGLKSRLDKCWIQDTCQNGRSRRVTATCKPDSVPDTFPRANVVGFATLLVRSPVQFLQQAGVDEALKGALARLASTSASHVLVAMDRNVTELNFRSAENVTRPLHVGFNISISGNSSAPPAERAVVAKIHLEEASSQALTELVNAVLRGQGAQALVEAADVSVSPGLETVTANSPSGQEFFAMVTLLRKYQEYLDEVRDDLQETASEMSIENLSREEFAVVQAKHSSAQERLSEIMVSHAELSQEIEDAITQRNLTKHALDVSQHAAQSAAAELVMAQANLSSTKADLAALKQKQVEAEHALLRALAAKDTLNRQLKENATRLGASLETVYDEVKYMRNLLMRAREANRSKSEELQSLQLNLEEEIADHELTKQMLEEERQKYDESQQQLVEEMAQHSDTSSELDSVLRQHGYTKQSLHLESVQHLRTKAKLREVEKQASTTTLMFALVVLSMFLLILGLGAGLLVALFRKRRSVEQIPVLGASDAERGTSVVVGRPVQPVDAWPPTGVDGTPGPTLLTSSGKTGLIDCLGSPMKNPKGLPDDSCK